MTPDKLLITFDSLRWDVFASADVPFLKGLGDWKRAYAQATYTFPAHMSYFMGKLPQTLDDTHEYDAVAIRFNPGETKRRRNRDFWRLDNPEAPRPAHLSVSGHTLIHGLRAAGHHAIGTGAVSWFNPNVPAGRYLTEPFDEFAFFDGPKFASHHSSRQQVAWLERRIAHAKAERPETPLFVFVNLGETHSRFVYEGCDWFDEPDPYGDAELCLTRQRRCLEHLDSKVSSIAGMLGDCEMVLFGDHGEALGEEGLWGHGFYHPKVMEVPMLIRKAGDRER